MRSHTYPFHAKNKSQKPSQRPAQIARPWQRRLRTYVRHPPVKLLPPDQTNPEERPKRPPLTRTRRCGDWLIHLLLVILLVVVRHLSRRRPPPAIPHIGSQNRSHTDARTHFTQETNLKRMSYVHTYSLHSRNRS